MGMMSVLRAALQAAIDRIDAGSCNMTEKETEYAISVLSTLTNKEERLSKYEAAKYLGVSRATFDNYVREGKIPKGKKQQGFKELSWSKKDLCHIF